jgi:cytidylate kinase
MEAAVKTKTQIESMLASIRAGVYLQERGAMASFPKTPAPFITISRQAGAGGTTLAGALERRLNQVDPGERPWTTWDKELVRKVAIDQHIPASLIESLESEAARPSWLEEFLSALGTSGGGANLDEYQLFRRVAVTVRTLALIGRCILVGRGGVYATADLPGGVHVRLVAPLAHRIAHMAKLRNLSEKEAADEVHRIDRERETFHRRYWVEPALLPEIFTITLNAEQVDEERMVDCILPLIRMPRKSAVAAMHQPVEVAHESQ